MKKKKNEEAELAKLMKLTKLMKQENVRVAPKGPPKVRNKWRSYDPKFAPKSEAREGLVEAGGMQVDPSLKEDYENWRKDKIAEQNERRLQAERKAKAEKERRDSETPPAGRP